jgi:hypothetical protein
VLVDDDATGVDEQGHRERADAEVDERLSVGIAQDREVHTVLVGELAGHVCTVVRIDADEVHAVPVSGMCLDECRELPLAGFARGEPKVDDGRTATRVVEAYLVAVEVDQREIGKQFSGDRGVCPDGGILGAGARCQGDDPITRVVGVPATTVTGAAQEPTTGNADNDDENQRDQKTPTLPCHGFRLPRPPSAAESGPRRSV